MYFSKLRYDHTIPMVLMRLCPSCKKPTVCVNTIGDFAYRCLNSSCINKNYLEFIPCMMEHRDFQKVAMNIKIGETNWITPEGDIDLDHPETNTEYEEGPYKTCQGILVWDTETNMQDGAKWFICNVCKAAYKGYIFCYYSLDGPHLEHLRYKQVENRDNRPWKITTHLSDYSPNKLHPIPQEWAMFIDEVYYMGNKIIYKKEGF